MRRNGSGSTKEENRKVFTRHDLALAVILLLTGVVLMFLISTVQEKGALVTVTVDRKLQGSYDLSRDREIRIDGEGFYNVLKIKDGKAEMISADCPDQICVKHRPISLKGETIICLPHKIVVEIISSETEPGEGIDSISR